MSKYVGKTIYPEYQDEEGSQESKNMEGLLAPWGWGEEVELPPTHLHPRPQLSQPV